MLLPTVHGRIPGPLTDQDDASGTGASHPLGIAAPMFAMGQLTIQAVRFLSDHGIMLDHKEDWEDGGMPFDKPEWPISPGVPRGHPISHTMGTKIQVEVTVEFVSSKARRGIKGKLIGDDPDLGIHFEKAVHFRSGVQKIKLISDHDLPNKVRLMDLRLVWSIEGSDISPFNIFSTSKVLAFPIVSKHEMFVTMNEPQTVNEFPDVTYRRLQHAVKKVAETATIDPHAIVKHLMESFGRFELTNNPKNAWLLGDPNSEADCRTIVRYVINLLKMVGCPGEAYCMIVFEKLSISFPSISNAKLGPGFRQLLREPADVDFTVVAEPPPMAGPLGGLDRPQLIHPNGRWKLVLFDGDDGANVFEACLLFKHGGKSVYHAGGVGEYGTPQEVIHVFSRLAWAKLDKNSPATDDDDMMVPANIKPVKIY